jgi:hypothetical protein
LTPEFDQLPMQRIILLGADLRQLLEFLAEFVLPP